MKKIRKVLCTVAFLSTTIFMCACGGDDTVQENEPTKQPVAEIEKTNNKGIGTGDNYLIPVDIAIQLEEYDEDKNTTGAKANNRIECGKRYKLSLIGNGVAKQEELKDKIIDLEIRVKIGQESTGNAIHFESYYKNEGGLDFAESEEEQGVYIATCQLSKKKNLDFSQGYFVIGVDSMEGSESNIQPIILEINPILSEEDKDTIEVQINGHVTLKNDLTVAKGEYTFTKDNNVSYGAGQNVEKTTMYIKLPEQSQGVTVAFYMDEDRKEYYGTTEVLHPKKGEDTVSIVLSKYLKEYMGEEKYEDVLDKGGRLIYLTITALGGNSYNDVAIDISYSLE